MLTTVESVTILTSVLLGTWVVALFWLHVTRPLHRGDVARSLALVVVGIGVTSYLAVVAVFISPVGGSVFIAVTLFGIAFTVIRSRAWRVPSEVTWVLLLTAATVLVDLGALYLWRSDAGFFEIARTRFLPGGLTHDNVIPALFAEHLGHGQSTHQFAGDWNGSDRPPLQAGFILLLSGLSLLFGRPEAGAAATSLVAQVLWLPAAYALLRSLGAKAQASAIAVTFAALTSTIVINSDFTWPKLLAAALVCASLALVVSISRDRKLAPHLFVAAVVASTLGLLAHGASAFALPTLAIAAVWQIRKVGASALLLSAGGGAAFAALYVPWMLFQRFVDPPGDRLLKWHLGGDTSITDESALSTIRHAYAAIGPREAWSNKVANLSIVFDANVFRGVFPLDSSSRGARAEAEFYMTTNALGLAVLLLGALAITLVVRSIGRRRIPPQDRRLAAMCAITMPSLVLWCLLMFTPRSTVVHQGSHVWIVILLTCPAAWLAGHWPRAGWTLVALQGSIACVELGPSWSHGAVIDPLAAVAILGGVALAVWGHLGLARDARSESVGEFGVERPSANFSA